MPPRLGSKPCIVCGVANEGRMKNDGRYYYPKRCAVCRAVFHEHLAAESSRRRHEKWSALGVGPRSVPVGTIRLLARGYRQIKIAEHVWEFEHRLVAEAMLGRRLRPEEVVHHRNHNKADNRPENLQVFSTSSEHAAEHQSGRPWSRYYAACVECGSVDRKHCAEGLCMNCYARARRLIHDPRVKAGRTLHPKPR